MTIQTLFHRIRLPVIYGVLVIGLLIQLKLTIYDHAIPRFIALTSVRGDALARSVEIAEGHSVRELVVFLRTNIPEDAKVLMAPFGWYRWFSHHNYVQFFLFPREIHNCGEKEVAECIGRVTESRAFYIPAIDDWPPRELMDETWEFIPFDEQNGLYIP